MEKNKVGILGAGVSGLSSAWVLKDKTNIVVFEKSDKVGGLAKTYQKDGFKFDLGGHRFFSQKKSTVNFFQNLLKEEMLWVDRKSRILHNGDYFFYPLQLQDVITHLSPYNVAKIALSYIVSNLFYTIRKTKIDNVEDWMIRKFGKELYQIFFKSYTEKVWGIPCKEISKDWATQRIKGMSVLEALKNFFVDSNKKPITLIDQFMYPKNGIGSFCDKIQQQIGSEHIKTECKVIEVRIENKKVYEIVIQSKTGTEIIAVDYLISSIPLSRLVEIIRPTVPENVLDGTKLLRYRSIVIVAVFTNNMKIINDTWMYIQDTRVRMTRVHEPKNWSANLAPLCKSCIVVEYPCFVDDDIWLMSDDQLGTLATKELELIKLVNSEDVISTSIVREECAYPIYLAGYEKYRKEVVTYLRNNIENLQIIGRNGMHRYYNMDHCIETGVMAALNLTGCNYDIEAVNIEEAYLEKGQY